MEIPLLLLFHSVTFCMKQRYYNIIILFLLLSGCAHFPSIKAVYVHLDTAEIQQRYGGEMGALADELKEAGVTHVFVPVLNNGTAYYPSDILPRRWDYGTQILALRHELRRRSIEFIAVVQVFQDIYTYQARPDIRPLNQSGKNNAMETLAMVCPVFMDYQGYKLNVIDEIMLIFQPDGINLKDCYYPVKWQDISSVQDADASQLYGFNAEALASFDRFLDVTLPLSYHSNYELGQWILTYHEEEWINWKCKQITYFVEKANGIIHGYAPDCSIYLETIPWYEHEHNNGLRRLAGMDLKTLSDYIDYAIPMNSSRQSFSEKRLDSLVMDYVSADLPVLPQLDVSLFHHEEQFRSARVHYGEKSIVNNWESMLKYRRYLNVFKSE